jgi:hypothetical protein
MQRRLFVLLLTFVIIAPTMHAQDVPIKGVDLFDTSQITVEQIQQRFGNDIKEMVKANLAGDDEAFSNLYDKILSGIQAMGDFAYIGISPVTYFDKGKYVYVTIDIVDQKDNRRLSGFLPAPDKEFSDPDGLLAAWEKYEKTASDLLNKGELKASRPRCPALHCVWGFDHPGLRKYEGIFRTKVPKNKERLKAILHGDKLEMHRAYAAFLLAHISDPAELVQTLLPSIRDSSPTVRNNVMRVLSDLAQERKDVAIPIDPLIEALDFPETTDRNKSLVTLEGLAARPENKEKLIRQAGPKLIKILRLLQPNNHDSAYTILKKISEKDFGDRNYKAWQEWLDSQAMNR